MTTGVMGLGVYLPNVSTPLLLAVSNGKLFYGSSGVMTSVYTGLNASNICSIVQVSDVALVVDGASGILAYKYGKTPYLVGVPSPQTYNLLASFEASETWVVVNGTQTPDEGQFIHGYQSINFTSNVGATMTASRTLPSALNLTTLPDGSASSTSDLIRIAYLLRGDPTTFTSCKIYLGDVGFANSYYYDLSLNAKWTGDSRNYIVLDISVPKSAFSSTGAPNWNSIAAIKFDVVAVAATQASLTLDFLTHVKAPPTPADSGVAGNLNGSYYYKMTFLTGDDGESEGSLLSGVVAVTNHKVSLTTLPISGSSRVVRRRLYRLGGTQTTWKLVYQFEDNTITTFTDNVGDLELGLLWSEVSGQPFIPQDIIVHGKYVVIVNLTTQDGVYYPDGIQVSDEGSFEIFNVLNFFTLEEKSGIRIKWVHSEFNKVYLGKEDSVWSFDPSNLAVAPVCETRLYGGVGVNGVCSGENSFFYVDRFAIVMCTGSSHQEISSPWVRNYLEQVLPSAFYKVWLQYYDHNLYVGLPIVESEVEHWTILVRNSANNGWSIFTGWDAITATTSLAPAFGRHLYLGHATQGFVYDALVGDDDAGTPISSELRLKDSDFSEPETFKDYLKLFLLGAKLTATNVQLTLTPYLDKVSSGIDINDSTTLIDSLVQTNKEIPMPSLGGIGVNLSVKITATGRWLLRSLVQIIRRREVTF